MGGFESCMALQQMIDQNIDSLADADRDSRRAYRDGLRDWADAEGCLTLEISIETRMRRVREQQAEAGSEKE